MQQAPYNTEPSDAGRADKQPSELSIIARRLAERNPEWRVDQIIKEAKLKLAELRGS